MGDSRAKRRRTHFGKGGQEQVMDGGSGRMSNAACGGICGREEISAAISAKHAVCGPSVGRRSSHRSLRGCPCRCHCRC